MARSSAAARSKKSINTLPLYIALIILFVLFIFLQNRGAAAIIIGAMLFALLITTLVIEILISSTSKNSRSLFIELAVAVIAVVVIVVLLRVALHTSNPIDVVPSCSMLPYLKRGDLVFVQGTTAAQLRAPIINVNASAWNYTMHHINDEYLECVAYTAIGNRIYFSSIVQPGSSVGLLYQSSSASGIVTNDSQLDVVRYACGTANVLFQNSTIKQEAYTVFIKIANTVITGDRNNSVVVYKTAAQDAFYRDFGDTYVVHRVYAVINASGSYYVLTKGDNNPGLDLQYGNLPINQSSLQGRVIASVPYLGYLKLVLSGSFSNPAGCNSTVIT